ncbi:DUF4097 family beta strand repeat-containing protein [Kribbella sp.]|uniref:DUF4097 family beta strand repeat-containing protein n=1 Tax=Kribbella sp. TaxID=1871183 RepID=UPI002D46B99E|nr:DUF4097 family beta strand repeat-containing protein [Kribbella sp.]HZX07795.1 DUF4097 family beta strand repeat-containing protein [Kribbella sp.]
MSDVQSRPRGTMSTERRYGIAISVALILGGTYWALTGLTDGTKTGQSSYPVQGTELTVKSASANVEVRPGDGTEVKVERQFERNVFGSDPKDSYDANAGRLELDSGGCGFLSFGCKTSYVLTVPRNVKLNLDGSSGHVTVSGLEAGADLKTSSGGIEVHDVTGPLDLRSSSGSLDADGLASTAVSAHSSSGSMTLGFAAVPQSIDAKASSGDVSIELPPGDTAYKLETDTSSGDRSANVKSDPGATRTITARTSSGDVSIEYTH